MGFGGETTLLGCKIGVYNRLPASFYVSVAYNCWAYRRLGVTIHPETGEIMEWLYQEGDDTLQQEAQEKTEQREIVLQAPITEEQIRELRVGDVVTINGMMYTGRDAIHKHLMDNDCPVDLNGQVIYHCASVVVKMKMTIGKLKRHIQRQVFVKNRTKVIL